MDLEIVDQLKDGRKSANAIAKELGISHNTVNRRIEKMTQADILKITALVDTNEIPGHQLALLGIILNSRDLAQKATEISQLNGVIGAGVVTGRYDIIAIVMLNQELNLLKFQTIELAKVENISFTETFIMYKTAGLKFPYSL